MQHTTSSRVSVARWASRVSLLAAVSTVAVVTAASAVDAQDRRDFNIVNADRRVPITRLNVSSSARTEWGGNVLRSPLAPGQRTHIVFPRASADCLYDIRATYADGRVADSRRINLCRTATITVR